MSQPLNPAHQVMIQSVNDIDPARSVSVRAPVPDSFMFDTSANFEALFADGLGGNRALNAAVSLLTGAKPMNQVMSTQVWMGNSETELGLELEFHAEQNVDLEVHRPIMQLMSLASPSAGEGIGTIVSPGPRLGDMSAEMIKNVGGDTLSFIQDTWGSLTQGRLPRNPFGGPAVAGEARAGSLNNVEETHTTGNGLPQDTGDDEIAFASAAQAKKYLRNQISIRIGNFAFFDSVVITNVQKTYQTLPEAITGRPFYARVNIRFKPLFMILREDLEQIFAINNASPQSVGFTPAVMNEVAQTFPIPSLATPTIVG